MHQSRELDKHAVALADELAPFLGESLLALVYAAEIQEDEIVSQADENFVRKHDFALDLKGPQPEGGTWGRPKVMRDDVLGARIRGSLVGISAAMAKLKGEQLEGGVATRFADPAFPVMQKVAIALINPAELSDAVLGFAAESINLAERLLAAATVDSEIKNYCYDFVSRRCGERRALLIKKHLAAGQIDKVKELMLPSELFSLGHEFYSDGAFGADYPWSFRQSALLDELSKGLNRAGLSQLGYPAASWHGIDTLALESPAPVEAMATYVSPHRLAERSCELKLQLARIFWQSGLPASIFKPIADRVVEKAMRDVGQASVQDWEPIIRAIKNINEEMVMETAFELINLWGLGT